MTDLDYHLSINVSRNFGYDNQHPSLSHNRQLAFTLGLNSSQGTEIQILDLNNRTIRKINNELGCSSDFSIWSQNGLLAFVLDCPNKLPSIRILDMTQNKYLVIHDELNHEPIIWFSNDELLFLSADETNSHQIYKIHISTHNLQNLSNNELQNSLPSTSLSSKQITFSAYDPSKPFTGHNIFLWQEGKNDLLQITDNNAYNDQPVLSADGRIVFTSNSDGKSNLYIWSPLTNTISKLTNDTANIYAAIWSSDGRVVYISDSNEDQCIFVINPATHLNSPIFCAMRIKDLVGPR